MSGDRTDRKFTEGVFRRAIRDVRTRDRQRAPAFGLILTAIATALCVLVPADASFGIRASAAAASVIVGPLIAYLAFLAYRLLRAPFVQRDEARAQIDSEREADRRPDLGRFVDDFDGFVSISEASLPHPHFMISFHLDRSDRAREQAEHQRASDTARREALAEYRRLYRTRVIAALEGNQPSGFAQLHRATALAPETIWDLRRLSDALGRLRAGTQAVLTERIRRAEELVTSYRSDDFPGSDPYLDWEIQTRTILGEQSTAWQAEFSDRPQLELSPYGGVTEPQSRRIASILDDDISLLRRLADQQGSKDVLTGVS